MTRCQLIHIKLHRSLISHSERRQLILTIAKLILKFRFINPFVYTECMQGHFTVVLTTKMTLAADIRVSAMGLSTDFCTQRRPL